MILSFSVPEMLPYIRNGIVQAKGDNVGGARVKRQTVRKWGPQAERIMRLKPLASFSFPYRLSLWWKSRTKEREFLGSIEHDGVEAYAVEIAQDASGQVSVYTTASRVDTGIRNAAASCWRTSRMPMASTAPKRSATTSSQTPAMCSRGFYTNGEGQSRSPPYSNRVFVMSEESGEPLMRLEERPLIRCQRCGQEMEDRDCAEACEDFDCPFIGGERART